MTHYDILVIGAGISGIGAAIRLKQNGIENFVILEKGDALGGTWRDNTYPGCACDVPSALYSYSFAPNREWSRLFAGQEEIRRYIERTAGNHGVPGHVQFGTEVQRAQWNEDSRRWTVDTTAGTFTSDAIIAAAGPWNEPLVPDVPGLDTFPVRSSTRPAGTTTSTSPVDAPPSSEPGRPRCSSFPPSNRTWRNCTFTSGRRSGFCPNPMSHCAASSAPSCAGYRARFGRCGGSSTPSWSRSDSGFGTRGF